MKISFLLAFVFSISSAQVLAATVEIPVVGVYDRLENESLWKDIDPDEVPMAAVQMRSVEVPTRANQSVEPGKNHSKVYLQNDRMIVCYETCNGPQPELPLSRGKVELPNLTANNFISGKKRDEAWKAFKVLNVYYWTNKLFDRLETLGYKPSTRLMVVVDRDIAMPGQSNGMTNNAFFTHTDWSLNFLPTKNSFVFNMLGVNIHSPALDPSVAMHECAHSVFQDLIGDILNPSVLGLHEAIADYLAMSVLETRKIGIIFSSGKPIRSTLDDNAKKKTVYKSDMEAHDLGNVVNTALQHIRVLIPQKEFVDKVALETIKILGENPYILATHIEESFMTALQETAKAQNQNLSPALLASIEKVWQAYNIQTPEEIGSLPRSYFGGAENTSGHFEVSTELKLEPKSAKAWNLPAVTYSKIEVLKSVSGPELNISGKADSVKTTVLYAEVKNGNSVTPLWIHFSPTGLLGAYDTSGQLITPRDAQQKQMFKEVMTLNESLGAINQLREHQANLGTTSAPLFDNGIVVDDKSAGMKTVLKVKDQKIQKLAMDFPSLGRVEVIQRSGVIKTTLVGKMVNALLDGALSSLDSIVIYTVKAKSYPQLKTAEIFAGERFIGFEARFKAGGSTKTMITDFDADKNAQVLPKP